MLPKATELETVDADFRKILTPERIQAIVNLLPEDWLAPSAFDDAEENRQMYANFLNTRIAHSEIFVKEANDAREALI